MNLLTLCTYDILKQVRNLPTLYLLDYLLFVLFLRRYLPYIVSLLHLYFVNLYFFIAQLVSFSSFTVLCPDNSQLNFWWHCFFRLYVSSEVFINNDIIDILIFSLKDVSLFLTTCTDTMSRTDLLAARTRGFPAGIRYANQEVTQRRRLLQTVQAVNGNSGESWRMCYTLRESARPRA